MLVKSLLAVLRRTLSLTVLSVGIFSLVPVSALAAGPPAPLKKGMVSTDVIRLWGPPEQTVEYETKRETLWLYKNSEVMWRSGRVVSWKIDGEGSLSEAGDALAAEEFDSSDLQDEAPIPVSDILSEIMQEGGSEEEPSKRDQRRNRKR